MAVGFSGSNGGITEHQRRLPQSYLQYEKFTQNYAYPKEISYFINNVCNLKCKHCYVAYKEDKNALSVNEWKDVFERLISKGALTFGNVGKEPTLTWEKTMELLYYFKSKRELNPKIRFGLVTNGTFLDVPKIKDLEEVQPNYIDISLDGTKSVHDYIRGVGNYDKTINAIRTMSHYKVFDKMFISFTINKLNIATIGELISILYHLGVTKILISPYITLDITDELYLSNEQIVEVAKNIIAGNLIDFSKYFGLHIYIKNDYTTTRELMERFVTTGIIDKDNLFVDDYGVIFQKYTFGQNVVYFNYLPWNDYPEHAIRISHDGYVSNCLDMFFTEYPQRAICNVRTGFL